MVSIYSSAYNHECSGIIIAVLYQHFVEAPWELKASYAFKIFDFNKDAFICANNLEKLLAIITGDGLSNEEITDIVERVMNEADIGQNGKLAYPEFEHVISRAPDFINLFRMSV